MAGLRLAWWSAVLGLVAGCAKGLKVVPELATLPVDWEPFRWVDLTIGQVAVPRAAILVDVKDSAVAGPLAQAGDNPMQLDFGFAGTGASGIPLRLIDPVQTDSVISRQLLRGRVSRLGAREDSIGLGRPFRLGTLGLLFYGIKGLLIDQVRQQVGAPRAGTALPAPLTARMLWTEAREENGRLRVPLAVQSTRLGDLVFDPGSSLVPAMVDRDVWRQLTGRRGEERDNLRLAFATTGDSLVLLGAVPREPLSLGGITFPGVSVFFAESGPAEFVRPRLGEGVVGVIGNQLFAAYRLLYVNIRAKRLGVLR